MGKDFVYFEVLFGVTRISCQLVDIFWTDYMAKTFMVEDVDANVSYICKKD